MSSEHFSVVDVGISVVGRTALFEEWLQICVQ